MSSKKSGLSGTKTYTKELIILTSLFFIWGFLTNLNTVLYGHLGKVFSLTATEAMLVQFCFFFAYFVMALPSGFLVKKMGYRKGIVVGLAAMALGCILFYPASTIFKYPIFLGALFILASGITMLQVAANPYVTVLGKPETASSRLNFAQALNSIGGTIAPIVGAILIVSSGAAGPKIEEEKLGISARIAKKIEEIKIALAKPEGPEVELKTTWEVLTQTIKKKDVYVVECPNCGEKFRLTQTVKKKDVSEDQDITAELTANLEEAEKKQEELASEQSLDVDSKIASDEDKAKEQKIEQLKEASKVQGPYLTIAAILILVALFFAFIKLPEVTQSKEAKAAAGGKKIWQYKHLMFGVLGIFVYVGAEVGVATMLADYLSKVLYLFKMETATAFVSLYWGGALVGRLLGAVIMQKYDPKKMLALFGACATLMLVLTILCAHVAPYISFVTIVLVGFFNSIMFPTIFSLAIAGLGDKTSQGSALLNMGIVGGAIIPLLMGVVSDNMGLGLAFLIPLVCYAYITFFGVKGAKTS